MSKNRDKVLSSQPEDYMPEIEVNRKIVAFEVAHDLLRFEVDGWCAWPLLRQRVGAALNKLPLTTKNKLGQGTTFRLALQDAFKLPILPKARFLIKTYSSARAEEQAGLYRDIYFDDLLTDISRHGRYLKIESINNPVFLAQSKKALIKSDLTTTPIEMLPSLLGRFRGPASIPSIATTLSACIHDELGLEIFTPRLVSRYLLRFYWAKRLYAWLLDRIQPEVVLLADGGEYAIVAAAKERHIKTIELQHGFIDRASHLVYTWTNYALPYKSQMAVPDRLLLFGDYWQQELVANGFWNETIGVVGSMKLDRYYNIPSARSKGSLKLVLTTQGIDQQHLITFMLEFIKSAQSQVEFELYIKLHPAYETNKEPYLVQLGDYRNVHVILGNEEPATYTLLSYADFHLSISSTTHYESLGLGVPTIILPCATHELVLHLHQSGHAFLAQTPQELLRLITQQQGVDVPPNVRRWYFKPGALENIKGELGLSS